MLFALLALTVAQCPSSLPEEWSSRPLESAPFASCTPDEVRVLRNEVFARHGYVFKSEDLVAHFAKQPWYHADPSFDSGSLRGFEQVNVDFLKKTEDAWRTSERWLNQRVVSGRLSVLRDDGALMAGADAQFAVLRCTQVAGVQPYEIRCLNTLQVFDSDGQLVASTSEVPAVVSQAVAGNGWHIGLSAFELGREWGALIRVEVGTRVGDDSMDYDYRAAYFVVQGKRLVRVLDVPVYVGREGGPDEASDLSESTIKVDSVPLPKGPRLLKATTRTRVSAQGVKRADGSWQAFEWRQAGAGRWAFLLRRD